MIVVTGGAGFIGSNLVAGLNRMGRTDILIIDNLGQGTVKHRNLNAVDFADLYPKEDCIEVLERWADEIEVVFHQGACSATTESDHSYLLRNNHELSKQIYAFCQGHGIPFIYASSASVYGNGEHGFVEERRAEEPLNGYAFSKHLFDQWVRRRFEGRCSQVVGLRYFNVYGPQENHKQRMASVIWQFHQQVKAGNPMKLFEGSDTFRRDFIHVDDVVAVNLFFWQNPELSAIVNVGTGNARSFVDIANILKNEWQGSSIEYTPFPADLKGKYQAYTQADLGQLRGLGYDKPFISLEEGVKSYAQLLHGSDGYLLHPSKA